MNLNTIVQSDALELMASLPEKSVDAIITDLPYGTTACSWDTVIPFAPMWAAVKRILKPRGAFVTTASQPFTSALVMSNPGWFRHEWIWRKDQGTVYLNANRQPMKNHESVLVFGDGAVTYRPIKNKGAAYRSTRGSVGGFVRDKSVGGYQTVSDGSRYPFTVMDFTSAKQTIHPTQKPIALYAYLIKTYTQPGDIVLDPFVGSGTTALAAFRTGRNFICGDQSAEYIAIANKRLADADPAQDTEVKPGIIQRSLFS